MVYRRTANVEAKMQRTRAGILRAARRLVGELGLRGFDIAAVADSADVGIGTVYRYFPTKDALLGEVVNEICTHEIEIVATVANEPVTHLDRLTSSVACFARRASASGRTAYAVIAEPAPPEIELDRIEHRRALAEVFAGVVGDGVADGAFPEQDPVVSAAAIVGAVSEVIVGPLSPSRRSPDVDLETVLAGIIELVRRAVGAPAPSQMLEATSR